MSQIRRSLTFVHPLQLVSASTSWYWPPGHEVQLDCASLGLYWPVGQLVQLEAMDGEYVLVPQTL